MSVTTHDVLVFDFRNPCGQGGADALGQWYVWKLPGTSPIAAVMHQGIHRYLGHTATVRTETEGSYADDGTDPILRRIAYGPISANQFEGAQRVYRCQAKGTFVGVNTLRVTASVVTSRDAAPTVQTWDIVMATSAKDEFEFAPSLERGSTFTLVFEDEGVDLTAGWKFKLVAIEFGSNGRMRRIDVGQRIAG